MDPNCWFPSATSVSLTLCLLPPPLPLLPLTRSPATYSLTHLLSPFFTMFLFSLPSILSQRHLFFFSFCPLSSPPASSHLLIPLCPSLLLILLALTLPKYNYLYLDYYGWSIWWIIQWDNRHVNCQRFFCTVYTEVTSLWYLREQWFLPKTDQPIWYFIYKHFHTWILFIMHAISCILTKYLFE